jgi:acyl-CoA synthetase (AMP-forming)/AMP-acid ligase II
LTVHNIILFKYNLKCNIIFHIISAKDEETGEIPVAFVVKKVGSVLSPKHVIDYVAEQVLFSISQTYYITT